MMRAKNGALYFLDSYGSLWVKEAGTPSDPSSSYGWRTCVAGGIRGIPLQTFVAVLAPLTVVAIGTGDETPEDLARYEAEVPAPD